ncbi:hypothetical protein C8Q72DRAFT_630813 [Fomitopsis betulina]|nr:hypothetical protein C8Q72DRAFT_630813 [Fomitopsis betulina]
MPPRRWDHHGYVSSRYCRGCSRESGQDRSLPSVACVSRPVQLGKLSPVKSASYRAISTRCCLTGTRVDILKKICTWATTENVPSIFLLAGSGKSTIAVRVCIELYREGHLGGSFFCSRSADAGRRDVRRIFPTFAYFLANRPIYHRGVDDKCACPRGYMHQFLLLCLYSGTIYFVAYSAEVDLAYSVIS